MTRILCTLFTISAIIMGNVCLASSVAKRLLEGSHMVAPSSKQNDNNIIKVSEENKESDETNFQLLTFTTILHHKKFVAEVANENADKKSFTVTNECSLESSIESAETLPFCSLISQNVNNESNKITQQDLFLNKATEYTFDTDNAVLTVRNVESKIIKKDGEAIESEKICNTDVSYSFLNAKSNKPFAYTSDKMEVLSIKVVVSGGNCNADNTTPLLNIRIEKADIFSLSGYLVVLVLIGLIQAVTCGVLVILIDKNNTIARNTSIGTLSMLISFDLCIYLQHFTYWTTLSNLMIIVFVLFFVISVFFEPAVLYFVFSTLQRRQNVSVRSLLIKLYFWLIVSAVGVIITQTCFSDYIFYAYPLCLFPQIVDSMLKRQKYKWNYALLVGLGLPKLVYMMVLTLDPFELFTTKLNPSVALFAVTAIAIELCILKIQTKYPGLGIIKKFASKSQFSYECQVDEVEAVSAIVCSICTEKVGLSPIIGQQPTQDQEECRSEPVMKTPCMHYYHESCLKEWFKKKFECPNCRQILPPLDNEDEE